MEEIEQQKQELIEEISGLIGHSGEMVELSPDVMRHFELEQLESIRDELLEKKKNTNQDHLDWLMKLADKNS